MTNVKNYTDQQIIDRVESIPSFKGWKPGKYLFGVRSNEDAFNEFDDKFYSFDVPFEGSKPVFANVFTGTTNAGKYGLKHFEDYNKLGCAVLKADVLVYDSHKFGKHKGKIDAYVQNKPFPYYRDNDHDDKSEELGKEYNDIIGANIHPAGEHSTIIENWSTACQVMNVKTQFNKFLVWANKLNMNVCILSEF